MPQENTAPARSLVKKLAEVMKEVGRIPKNGKNTFHNYKYVMESDLVEKLSDLLAGRHVFITSSTKGIEVIEHTKLSQKQVVLVKTAVLRVEYTFHDGESGETLTMESVGEIDQDGGKGLYKALTGAMKYFLMKNFLVATGDDPEEEEKKPEHASPVARKPQQSTGAAPASIAPATQEQLKQIDDLCGETNTSLTRLKAAYKIKGDLPTVEAATAMIDGLQIKLTKMKSEQNDPAATSTQAL